MIDMISGGRLISGFVRGGGVESLANNVNPVHNRERFEEAHDLIIAAWTRKGPFSWDGKHFQYRVVNPWALPLQKPHPPVMVPGTVSPETVAWAAKHRYPYVVLGSSLDQTRELQIQALDRGDGRVPVAGVADHVAVRIVYAREAVATGS